MAFSNGKEEVKQRTREVLQQVRRTVDSLMADTHQPQMTEEAFARSALFGLSGAGAQTGDRIRRSSSFRTGSRYEDVCNLSYLYF